MNEPDDLARRAEELKARADRVIEDATDADELRGELDRLDAELAQLEDELRRLDEDVASGGAQPAGEPARDAGRPSWAEMLFDLVSDVTEHVAAVSGTGWLWRSSETVERSVTADDLTDVVIENRAGSIRVERGDTRAVTVAAELFAPTPELREEMTVTAERDGAHAMVSCHWPEHRRGRRARVTVTVPAGTQVRASTSGGSITIEGTRGSAAVATRGGSVSVSGTAGDIEVRTAGGSVRVDDHTGSVDVATNGGSIRISGVLTGVVRASTRGGSVSVEGADRATVNASASGGSINVRGRLAGHNSIRTAGGSVTVSIPADNYLQVEARGSNATCEFAGLDVQRGHIHGTLGDGRDGTLEFRTLGGTATLAKT